MLLLDASARATERRMSMIPGWQMEAYERLRNEIVRQATNDLKRALRKSAREGAVCNEQIAMERWFLSPWGQMLCEDMGERIIELCHRNYKANHGKLRSAPMTQEAEEKAYKDYKVGLSKKEILQKYNITSYQYCQMLRRRGR